MNSTWKATFYNNATQNHSTHLLGLHIIHLIWTTSISRYTFIFKPANSYASSKCPSNTKHVLQSILLCFHMVPIMYPFILFFQKRVHYTFGVHQTIYLFSAFLYEKKKTHF